MRTKGEEGCIKNPKKPADELNGRLPIKSKLENSLVYLLFDVYPPGMLGIFGIAQIKFSRFGKTAFHQNLAKVLKLLAISPLLKNMQDDRYWEVVNLLGSSRQNCASIHIRELFLDYCRCPISELFMFSEDDGIEDHSDSQNGLVPKCPWDS